jgi:hypothetical protein
VTREAKLTREAKPSRVIPRSVATRDPELEAPRSAATRDPELEADPV